MKVDNVMRAIRNKATTFMSGADVHLTREVDLIRAVRTGDLDRARFIHDNFEVSAAFHKNLPLLCAAYLGNEEMGRFLLGLPEVEVGDGEEALIAAVMEGHLHIVRMLLLKPGFILSSQKGLAHEVAGACYQMEIAEFLQNNAKQDIIEIKEEQNLGFVGSPKKRPKTRT
jgi:ankyrin repeat protein